MRDATLEQLHELLFELSSAERMNIMLELQNQALRLSQVSKRLDMTISEASRHLERLCDAKLIQKESNGTCGVSAYGKLVLSLLSGLRFAATNRDYWFDYDASGIPDQFIGRLGETKEGVLELDVFKSLENINRMFRESQNYVWVLTNQALGMLADTLIEKLKIGDFDLRSIVPEAILPTLATEPYMPFNHNSFQIKVVPKNPIVMAVTERDAGFCLPNDKGEIDYRGFCSNDPKFHQWCKDLFLYYWDRAKPVSYPTEYSVTESGVPTNVGTKTSTNQISD